MKNDTQLTESGGQYWAAYAAHYKDRDLPRALKLYLKVIASHPFTEEANHSRAQAQNIINTVVPKQELLDAQIELALAHLEQEGPPDTEPIAVGQLAVEVSA